MALYSTSMMCVDYFKLESQFKVIEKNTDFYHIDIMDGHFVPNLALSFDFIKQLKEKTSKPIDVHLMVEKPDMFIDLLVGLNVNSISFHPETVKRNIFSLIKRLKENKIKIGIALSPSDDLEKIKSYLNLIDKITVMTVEPGFAGQKVIRNMIHKINEVRTLRETNKLDFLIEIDGSNNYSTFKEYFDNGADIFILGSTLFKEDDIQRSFDEIKNYIEKLKWKEY